jgi:glycyl-tRNA synthetase alpha subunit
VPVLAAYDLCLKCSHLFNLLDARGAVSVTERVGIIGRIRNLTVGVARAYAATLATPENETRRLAHELALIEASGPDRIEERIG